MKSLKLLIIMIAISLSSFAQSEPSAMFGYGGAIYKFNTAASSNVGLSLRFALNRVYFDVSSNLAGGVLNWVHYSQANQYPLVLTKTSTVNVWSGNMGYMIPIGPFSITPTIGYAQAQQFQVQPVGYDYMYGIPMHTIAFGIMLDVPIAKMVSMYAGASTAEYFKFGMAINFNN